MEISEAEMANGKDPGKNGCMEEHDHAESDCHCCHHDHHDHIEAVDGETLAQASDTVAVFRIAKMDCPMEEQLIRKKLSGLPGVAAMKFNLMQRVLTVEHEPGLAPQIISALKSIDMDPEILNPDVKAREILPAATIPWKKLIVAGCLALLSEFCELAGEWNAFFGSLRIGSLPLMECAAFILALAAIWLSGLGTYRKGWIAISNFRLNINALMAVAVTGAVLIGQFPEAAMVMVLFNISEAIEALSLDRARMAIKRLMDLAPKMMSVAVDGRWVEQPVSEVPPGAIARVRPGEKIGLDGVVTSGFSEVNQAPITGESMPVEKKPGDMVFGGTINESGSFEYKVTAGAEDATLARIIHAVEEAQSTKAPMQRFVDVFAAYYTPCVFLLALAWAVLTPLLLGVDWLHAIYTSLVLLVIGCPCALVISTPVTVVSGMAAATAKGILIKGGLYLEQGRRLAWLALDKTGTITWGQPRETDFETLASDQADHYESVMTSLASRSDHPVSRAISRYGEEKGISLLEIQDFAAIPGFGVKGVINGVEWHLGNYKLALRLGAGSSTLAEMTMRLENEGKTVVLLIGPNGACALAGVADTIRKTSIEAIASLKKLGVKTIMLTGDNQHTAKAIAAEAGVNEFRANLLPNEKLEVISNLEKDGFFTGMVGDGINDAPGLAKADIGFAMAASGSDTAMETADVALMDDDLRKIPAFIRLSRATNVILWENIIFALGIKAVFFALTLTGLATMWMAVFADVGAALLVVANGLRARTK